MGNKAFMSRGLEEMRFEYVSPPYDAYRVYEDGTVYSEKTNKIIAPYLINTGYYCINLYHKNRAYKPLVHQLVARAFCPFPDRLKDEPPSNVQINHIDHTRTNNHYTNLEWCTRSENLRKGGEFSKAHGGPRAHEGMRRTCKDNVINSDNLQSNKLLLIAEMLVPDGTLGPSFIFPSQRAVMDYLGASKHAVAEATRYGTSIVRANGEHWIVYPADPMKYNWYDFQWSEDSFHMSEYGRKKLKWGTK